MDFRTTQYYAFDHGLDSASLADEAVHVSLPEQSTLVPPQLRYPAQLEQLLNKPDLGEFLANAFMLPTGDAVLSGPSQFAAALDDAQTELHALVSDSTSPLLDGRAKSSSTLKSNTKSRSKFRSKPRYDAESESKNKGLPESISETDKEYGTASGVKSNTVLNTNTRREDDGQSHLGKTPAFESEGYTDSDTKHYHDKPRASLPATLERLVQRAGRVLERENGLRADLASYRAALLKG